MVCYYPIVKPGRASVTVTLLNGVFLSCLPQSYRLYSHVCKTISIFVIETAVLMMAIAGTSTVAWAVGIQRVRFTNLVNNRVGSCYCIGCYSSFHLRLY
jgi:hypothetical protein